MIQKITVITLVLFLMSNFVIEGNCQWVQTNGPNSGEVTCFAVNGTNIFAGTHGGVFLSTNNGSNWKPVNIGLTSPNIHELVTTGNKLYAGTQDGIFLTTDNGKNWAEVSNGLGYPNITSLAIKDTTLFSGAYGGIIYRSKNGGGNWSKIVSIGYSGASCFVFNGTNIFAGISDSGVWRSTDDGITWSFVNSGLTSLKIITLVSMGTNLFAGTQDSGIFRSINNGLSWKKIKAGYNCKLFVSANNLYASTYDGVFLSSDNGANWTIINNFNANVRIFVNTFIMNGTNLYAGTNFDGIFISSNNGISWTSSNNGLSATNILTLAANSTNLFAGTESNGIFQTTNNGASWDTLNTDLQELQNGSSIGVLATNDTNIFAGYYNVYLSTNNGIVWSRNSDSGSISQNSFLNAIVVNDSDLFVGTSNGVSRSTNNGKNWVWVNHGLQEDVVNYTVLSLAFSGQSLFAGTSYGGIFRSTNSGNNWTNIINPAQLSYEIYSLVISDTNIIAGTYDGLFHSTDNGLTWAAINIHTGIHTLATSGVNVFAGGIQGFFFSSDEGTNWQQANTGLTVIDIVTLTVMGKYVYAGTYGGGVWRRPLSDFGISGVKNLAQQDLNISLSPNPTTGIITVHNAPANMMHVAITNVLAETVRELTNSGATDFTIDLSKLPSGTYFARFSLAGSVFTRKIIKE